LAGRSRLEGEQLVDADAEPAEVGEHLPQRRVLRDDVRGCKVPRGSVSHAAMADPSAGRAMLAD
jgi:hypothetical protein